MQGRRSHFKKSLSFLLSRTWSDALRINEKFFSKCLLAVETDQDKGVERN